MKLHFITNAWTRINIRRREARKSLNFYSKCSRVSHANTRISNAITIFSVDVVVFFLLFCLVLCWHCSVNDIYLEWNVTSFVWRGVWLRKGAHFIHSYYYFKFKLNRVSEIWLPRVFPRSLFLIMVIVCFCCCHFNCE